MPIQKKDGGCRCWSGDEYSDEVALEAKRWMSDRGLSPYSSTFTIAHRFKPGDRVQHKYNGAGPRPVAVTVAEVMLGEDCGVFYRFAEEGIPTSSISYCDENMRLADREDEAEEAKEMQ